MSLIALHSIVPSLLSLLDARKQHLKPQPLVQGSQLLKMAVLEPLQLYSYLDGTQHKTVPFQMRQYLYHLGFLYSLIIHHKRCS